MNYEIIILGLESRGVLSTDKTIAYSGIMENREVSWMPSYGPKQRGGASNVMIIVSDEPVSPPIVNEYDVVIVLGQPSFDKFGLRVKKDGILIYNPALIQHKSDHGGVNIYGVPATEQSMEMGNDKIFNMIIPGSTLKAASMSGLESTTAGPKKSLLERHHKLIPLNEEAIKRGINSLSKVN